MQQRRLTGRAARASNLAVADALSVLTVSGATAGVLRGGWQPLPLPALRPPPAAGINPSVARSPSLRVLTMEKRGAGLHPLPLPALWPPPAVLDIPFAARSPRVLAGPVDSEKSKCDAANVRENVCERQQTLGGGSEGTTLACFFFRERHRL